MEYYTLQREGLFSKRFYLFRVKDRKYFPLEEEDLNQTLLNFLVSYVMAGRINENSSIIFNSANTEDEFTERAALDFRDSFLEFVEDYYSGIKSGNIKLEVDEEGVVRAYSDLGEVQVLDEIPKSAYH